MKPNIRIATFFIVVVAVVLSMVLVFQNSIFQQATLTINKELHQYKYIYPRYLKLLDAIDDSFADQWSTSHDSASIARYQDDILSHYQAIRTPDDSIGRNHEHQLRLRFRTEVWSELGISIDQYFNSSNQLQGQHNTKSVSLAYQHMRSLVGVLMKGDNIRLDEKTSGILNKTTINNKRFNNLMVLGITLIALLVISAFSLVNMLPPSKKPEPQNL